MDSNQYVALFPISPMSCRRRRGWVPRSRRQSRWLRQMSATWSAELSRRRRLPSECCCDWRPSCAQLCAAIHVVVKMWCGSPVRPLSEVQAALAGLLTSEYLAELLTAVKRWGGGLFLSWSGALSNAYSAIALLM